MDARCLMRLGCAALLATMLVVLPACETTLDAASGPTTHPDPKFAAAPEPLRGTVYTSTDRYVVLYEITPNSIPLNEMFSIDVQVMEQQSMGRATDIELSVDGRMPEHRHGMNVDPIMTKTGPGAFHVEGMLFHMVGRWEIHFDITKNGMTERARMEVFLE